MYWAYFILGGSLVSEGGTLLMAINAIKKGALAQEMSFYEYGNLNFTMLKLVS